MKAGWEDATLGQICDIISGAGFPKKHQGEVAGEFPFFKVGDMNSEGNETSLVAANHYISEATRKTLGARILPPKSIVFPKVGGAISTNKKRKIAVPSCVDNNVMGLAPKTEKVLPAYLSWWMEGVDIYEFSNKAALPSITKTTVDGWPIPLPPLEEQKRIVAVLDAAFEGLTRARTHVEINLQNARELFELRRAKLFSEDNSTSVVPLGEVCLSFEYGTSSKSKPTGNMPVLRMGNLQDGELDWEKLVYSDDDAECEKYALRKGDVLFNRTNSQEHVGKTSIFDGLRPAIFAGYLIRVTPDPSKLSNEYLNHFLNSDFAREYGRSVMGKSVNQANISASRLKTYPIVLPNLERQVEISNKLDAMKMFVKEAQTHYRAKLQDLDHLRQSLLQKAFAGELT